MNRLILIVVGAFYALTGLALLLLPQWFYETIGTFPPFNRHFLGDVGAFTLPIGIGLLLALRFGGLLPGVLLVGVLGSTLHLLNHTYDAALGTVPGRGWSDVVGLLLVVVLMLVPAVAMLGSRAPDSPAGSATRPRPA